jgi:hypothetical protein
VKKGRSLIRTPRPWCRTCKCPLDGSKRLLDVKWSASEALGYFHYIRRGHKQKHGAWIDKATNEPRTGDPVDFRTSAGHPYSSTLTINRRKLGHWSQWKRSLPPCFEPSFQNLRGNAFVSKPRRNPLAYARAFLADHDGRVATGTSLQASSFSKVRWREEGMRRGSASNSSCGLRSINVGHFGVPMRRTSLSTEIVFGACIERPLLG